jgi:hypothetical protein
MGHKKSLNAFFNRPICQSCTPYVNITSGVKMTKRECLEIMPSLISFQEHWNIWKVYPFLYLTYGL